eukprot:513624_1
MTQATSSVPQETWKEKHITRWTSSDVSDWLQKLGPMKKYANNFIDIDGKQLAQLTDAELNKLIPNQTICKALKRKINQKKDENILSVNDSDDLKHDDNKIESIVGLMNLGSTCYLNSAIQALLSSKHFAEYFRNQPPHIMNRKNKLLQHWSELCQQTASTKSKVFSPRQFRNDLSKLDYRWGNGDQDDSWFVLFSILQVLDDEITDEKELHDNRKFKFNKEMIIDNNDTESALSEYGDSILMRKFISLYNPHKYNIVRTVFDGIICEESTCAQCAFCEKKYTPFRFFRLPLKSSIIVVDHINIYVPEKFGNKPLIMENCELLSYCNINTLKYIIQQYVYSTYELSSIKFKDIEIG